MKLGGFVICLAIGLLPASAAAQSATTSAIAGVVRDATGAVLPGVTVEASSPALIEKVRTVLTDGEGNYRIVDLRPGSYIVTFSLPGFSSVKREGIELTTGFTAAVNAELRVGELQETVTVTGASPVVDVQNARVQTVLSKELLESVPSGGQSIYGFMALTVGMVVSMGTGHDVGGTKATYGGAPSYHGINGSDSRSKVDGMDFNDLRGAAGGSFRMYHPNILAYSEVNMGLGGQTAESETAGVVQNHVPKDGGNRLSLTAVAAYANHNFQSDNLSSALEGRGLTNTGPIERLWDYGVAVGGPIRPDKLWFFVAPRWNGAHNQLPGAFYNATQHTPFYTPDLSRPAIQQLWDKDVAARVTWQVSPTHKLTFSHSEQRNCFCVRQGSSAEAPEAVASNFYFPRLTQGTWTHTGSNRLLFEGGVSYMNNKADNKPTGDVLPTDIGTVDQGIGITYGSAVNTAFGSTSAAYGDDNNSSPLFARFSASYVTGTHAFKVGVTNLEGWHSWNQRINESLQYVFLNRRPISLTQIAVPFSEDLRVRSTGVFAQDQWTMRRLTLSLGARFDAFKGWVQPHTIPAGRFVPERAFGKIENVPNFKDISPRVGAAYDVFGDGRTAIKGSFGRYLGGLGAGFTEQSNPALLIVTSTSRTWNDANANFLPDCDLRNFGVNGECGAINNNLFGTLRPATAVAEDVQRGWGKRWFTWQTTIGLQQELRPGLAATVTYARNSYGNILVNVNQAVAAADFTSYCVTAPSDARLPGGGGNQICGLFDVNPNRFGQVNTLIQRADALGVGGVTRVYNGVDMTVTGRFAEGGQLSGGLSLGRTVQDDCALNDLPQAFATGGAFVPNGFDVTLGGAQHPRTAEYCHVSPPWSQSTQIKITGVYPLPYGFEVAGVLQNLPGVSVGANRTYTNAEVAPALGRNLSAGAGATVSIPIVAPQTTFEGRLTQLDLRVAKVFRMAGHGRVKANLDIYNVLNGNTITAVNSAYGARWLFVNAVMTGRFARIGLQVDF